MKPDIGNYEYAARHQKARVLMEKNNLSALLITELTNLFYGGLIFRGDVISKTCRPDHTKQRKIDSDHP